MVSEKLFWEQKHKKNQYKKIIQFSAAEANERIQNLALYQQKKIQQDERTRWRKDRGRKKWWKPTWEWKDVKSSQVDAEEDSKCLLYV